MLLQQNQIHLDNPLQTKNEILQFVAREAARNGITSDQETLLQAFLDRETLYPTAFQEGIAIPHAKSETVRQATLFFIKTNTGIDWESPDQFKVTHIFAILVPAHEAGTKHIQILSALATSLMEDDFQEKLFSVRTKEDVLNLIKSVEMEVA